jgi:hypothetical protein
MAEKRKCDNKGDSSDKKRAYKTHSFKRKLGMEKYHVFLGGLSRSTVSIALRM